MVEETGQYAIVENVARQPVEGALPRLIVDARENFLLEAPGERASVYLKTVGSPYTGEHGTHFLVIPDSVDGSDIPGVKDLSPVDLGKTLQMAETVAYETLMQQGIQEVDFGLHHSRAEHTAIPKQRAATFPFNMHLHITGYSEQDMRPISKGEILHDPSLRGKIKEPLQSVGEDLFLHEVVEALRNDNPAFEEIFEQMIDQRGRLRFSMRNGREDFANPQLPIILQNIDRKAKEAYDELGKCFFEYDTENQQFVEKDDEFKRFKLLPPDERKKRISQYLADRPWLSRESQMQLSWISEQAKDEHEILERELNKEKTATGSELTDSRSDTATKQAANRFWAYKDLSYTMTWSARKSETGDVEWIFGFDPMIFTIEGVPRASAFTDKIILKKDGAFTPEQLTLVKQREKTITDAAKMAIPGSRVGPGYESL